MDDQKQFCTIVPYFEIHEGKIDEFKAISRQLVESAQNEPKCLYYGFCFNGKIAFCREAYEDALGVLEHLDNSGALIKKILEISDLTQHEIHGPSDEIDKLKGSLSGSPVQFFILEHGFQR